MIILFRYKIFSKADKKLLRTTNMHHNLFSCIRGARYEAKQYQEEVYIRYSIDSIYFNKKNVLK